MSVSAAAKALGVGWDLINAHSSRFDGRTSFVRQGPSRPGNQSRSDSSGYTASPLVTRSEKSSPEVLLDTHHPVTG